MVNIMTCYDFLNMAAFHLNQTISSLETMLIVANNPWKQYAYCWHTRSSIRRTFSCCVVITSVPASTESTDSTMNVSYCFVILAFICMRYRQKCQYIFCLSKLLCIKARFLNSSFIYVQQLPQLTSVTFQAWKHSCYDSSLASAFFSD